MDRFYLLTPRLLHETVFTPLERNGCVLSKIYLNFIDYADIRKFGRDVVDINTERAEARYPGVRMGSRDADRQKSLHGHGVRRRVRRQTAERVPTV